MLVASAHARTARVDASASLGARDAGRGDRDSRRRAASGPRAAAPRAAASVARDRTRARGVPVEHLAITRATFERHRGFRARNGPPRPVRPCRRFRHRVNGRNARRWRGIDRDFALALAGRARGRLERDVAIRIDTLEDRRGANFHRHRAKKQQQPRANRERRGSRGRGHVGAPWKGATSIAAAGCRQQRRTALPRVGKRRNRYAASW